MLQSLHLRFHSSPSPPRRESLIPSITSSSPFSFCSFRPNQTQKPKRLVQFCAPYEVGGGYTDEELFERYGTHQSKTNVEDKPDASEYEALLKGGEQVTSVLEEMITLVSSCFVFCVVFLSFWHFVEHLSCVLVL